MSKIVWITLRSGPVLYYDLSVTRNRRPCDASPDLLYVDLGHFFVFGTPKNIVVQVLLILKFMRLCVSRDSRMRLNTLTVFELGNLDYSYSLVPKAARWEPVLLWEMHLLRWTWLPMISAQMCQMMVCAMIAWSMVWFKQNCIFGIKKQEMVICQGDGQVVIFCFCRMPADAETGVFYE